MLMGYPLGLIVVDRDHIKEILEAPATHLDLMEALVQFMDFRYLFRGNVYDLYHGRVARNQLTQSLAALIPHIVDELTAALGDEIDTLLGNGTRCLYFVWLKSLL